jgi:Domain of unknown function (DUF4377)
MDKHISKSILFICLSFLFFLPQLACHAQKKQLIGTWILQEMVVETPSGNSPTSQKESEIIKNRIAFMFMKAGKFEVQASQGALEIIKGTWRMEKDVLLLTSDNKSFQQDMGKLRVKIDKDVLRLGILSESSLTPMPNTMVFVCKKGKLSDLITAPLAYNEEHIVKPIMVSSFLENFRVDAEAGSCDAKPCLRIKRDNATEWENFQSSIEGFEYEKGYEYLLRVEVTITETSPNDNTDQIISKVTTYKLVEVVSKTKK